MSHALNNCNTETVSPSGIAHCLDTGYACAYGAEEALMIRNLQYLITTNANRGEYFHEGRYWTRDRIEDFKKHFPYWTLKQIRRIVASLIKQNVILVGRFNNYWSDRTTWYAFCDEKKFIADSQPPKRAPEKKTTVFPKQELGSLPNGNLPSSQMGTSIYDTNKHTDKNTNNTPTPFSDSSVKADEVVVFPSLPSKISLYSEEVQRTTKKLFDLLLANNPAYRLPAEKRPLYAEVHKMLENEKQEEELLVETFTWGIKHTIEAENGFKGWSSVLYSRNPLASFRKHFAKIYAAMVAQPRRKFAPSSNDREALKIMERMSEGAI